MSDKQSKRDKARGLLHDAGRSLSGMFRSRSPRPSLSGANQPDPHTPSPAPEGTSSFVSGQNLETRPLPLDPRTLPTMPTLKQGVTQRTDLDPSPNPEPSEPSDPHTPIVDQSVAASAGLLAASSFADLANTSSREPPLGQPLTSREIQEVHADPAVDASKLEIPARPVETSSSALAAQDTSAAVLKSSANAIKKGINVVPTFKSIADILADCLGNIPTTAKNRKEFSNLASSIVAVREELEEQLSGVSSSQMTSAVTNTIQQLTQLANHINEKQERTRARAYVEADQDIDDLIECYRETDSLLRRLQCNATLNVWKIANENQAIASESLLNTILGGLNPVQMATYNSSAASQTRRRGCTENTRQVIIRDLRRWASDPQGAKVYWMNGMAGTGKTTIAYSLCSELESSGQLAASFFCSRLLPECQDVSRIIPTITYRLAIFYPLIKEVLCRLLGSDPTTGTHGVMTQFEQLVHRPLQAVKDKLPDGLLIVVIDALDECSSRSDVGLLLSALLRFVADLPLKFFITCRPDTVHLEKLSADTTVSRSLFHLHDIERSLVQADIETYLTSELEPIHPPVTQIQQLAEQSGRLFIFAATVVRYIGLDDPYLNHRRRLESMLGIVPNTSRKAYTPLDTLYSAILSTSLGSDRLEDWEKGDIELVLHTVVCAKEPLSVKTLTQLLQLASLDHARQAIEPLRSVLHIDAHSGLVSTLHASFPDYLLTSARSGRFLCDRVKHNKLLAERCFGTMKDMLRFNICSLESSSTLDHQLSDLPIRTSRSIPAHLFYACRYWSDYLLLGETSSELLLMLQHFLCQQVLYWVEVMNLKRATGVSIGILAQTYSWMK
ncbi:hypothetical protein FRC09_002970, partial [Ceratobasidium sp. 395]